MNLKILKQENREMKCILNQKKYKISRNYKTLNLFKPKSNNIMYILFRAHDSKLKFSMEESKSSYISKGYEIIGSKVASLREFKLLRLSLSEIIMNKRNQESKEEYLQNILSYCSLLGCKINTKKKFMKKLSLSY